MRNNKIFRCHNIQIMACIFLPSNPQKFCYHSTYYIVNYIQTTVEMQLVWGLESDD